MDLVAYAQIGDLSAVAERNGIHVGRLRGYRMMRDEQPLPDSKLKEYIHDAEVQACEDAVCSVPAFSMYPRYRMFSSETLIKCKKYLTYNNNTPTGIRWDRLHGKKRKVCKYLAKDARLKTLKQWSIWNSLAGAENVLYIHARIGSNNWSGETWMDYVKEPWFIAGVDDAYDETYCDIYAKIMPEGA